jgi:hypothetical protein
LVGEETATFPSFLFFFKNHFAIYALSAYMAKWFLKKKTLQAAKPREKH